jgi:hypothetical protein
MHGNLEAVAEINVDDFPRISIQHQIRRVPIPKTQDITNHRHYRQ